MRKKIIALAILGRLGMSPLTMSVPVLGALSATDSLALGEILTLMLLGLCAHLFGFGLNDIIDHPIDQPVRQKHPLTSGWLKQWEAWIFVLFQLPLAPGIYYFWLQGQKVGLGVLILSIFLSVIYNLFSKRGFFSRLMAELSLAGSIGLLCAAGTLTQTENLPPESAIFATTLTLILLLLNSIPSGLKDLKTDEAFGAQSFVLAAGCTMLDDDHYFLPSRLRWYSGILQLTITSGIAFLLIEFRPALLLSILIMILTLYSALHLRMLLQITSFNAIRFSLPLLNGFYNYAALSLILVDRMPLWLQLLYVGLVIGLIAVPLRIGFGMLRYKLQEL